ncbi:MAG: Imm5 family immunity protein [Chloroflexota bacterium]
MPTMSKELQRACDIALDAMRKHPQSALLPYYRWTIYRALGPINSFQTRFLRVRLALLSARKVQYVWQEEQPGDTQVLRFITLAHKVLRDEILPEIGRAQAEDALDQVAALVIESEKPGKTNVTTRAQSAMLAAIEALFEASGTYTFNTAYNYEGETDIDLDPWSSDAALYAAIALSGAVWNVEQAYAKRSEFWEWWLLEAIPSLYTESGCQGT